MLPNTVKRIKTSTSLHNLAPSNYTGESFEKSSSHADDLGPGTLPPIKDGITGLHFTAGRADTGILLKWNTASEQNNERFDILHSMDGIHYSKLTHIAARGNSKFPSKYEWIDVTPTRGTNHYRLQQFNKDGDFRYSEVLMIL
jgi:hypothetical protein